MKEERERRKDIHMIVKNNNHLSLSLINDAFHDHHVFIKRNSPILYKTSWNASFFILDHCSLMTLCKDEGVVVFLPGEWNSDWTIYSDSTKS